MAIEDEVGAAFERRDVEALRGLAAGGNDLNQVLLPGAGGPATVLERALRGGDPALVSGVLAVPGVSAERSLPAFGFWAWARSAPLAVVREFLDRSGVPPEHRDGAGRTVLHEVASGDADPAVVGWLLGRMAADPRAEDGTTPFFQAAVHGHRQAARLLLDAGADPNASNTHTGWTALIAAVAAGEERLAGWLVTVPGLDVDRTGADGGTALHRAAALGNAALVATLLAGGAIRTAADRYGRTPLIAAARRGAADVTVHLLAGTDGTATGVNLVDVDRRTALHHAVIAGSAPVVELLLAQPQANLAITDRPDGRTALALATATGQDAIADALRATATRLGEQPDTPANDPPPRPDEPPLRDPHHAPGIPEPIPPNPPLPPRPEPARSEAPRPAEGGGS